LLGYNYLLSSIKY